MIDIQVIWEFMSATRPHSHLHLKALNLGLEYLTGRKSAGIMNFGPKIANNRADILAS